MVVVVLNASQRPSNGCAGDEYRTHPVVNQAARYMNGRVPRPRLREYVAFLNAAGPAGIRIRPKKGFRAVERCLHLGFGLIDVGLESRERFLLQLDDTCSLCHERPTFSDRVLGDTEPSRTGDRRRCETRFGRSASVVPDLGRSS